MRAFLKGFVYAGWGIAKTVQEEKNMRFHLCAAFYVLLFSLFYSFTRVEYCLLFIVIFLVFSTEMVNTSIERIVDKLFPEQNETAGLAKDVAAGAVLVVCIGAVVCGFLLFWNLQVFSKIIAYFSAHILLLFLLLLSLVLCVWFVFGFGRGKKTGTKKGDS